MVSPAPYRQIPKPRRLEYAGYVPPTRRRAGWLRDRLPSRGVLLGLALALGLWATDRWWRPLLVSPIEQRILLRATDLPVSWCPDEVDERHGTTKLERRLDGTLRLTYRYREVSGQGPKVECTAQRYSTAAEAKADQALAPVRLLVDWGLERRGRVGLVEQDAAFFQGALALHPEDEVQAYRVELDGKPVGQALCARVGAVTYDLALHGAWGPDDRALAELLLPKLQALAAWVPEQ